jgi:hypothetical protein
MAEGAANSSDVERCRVQSAECRRRCLFEPRGQHLVTWAMRGEDRNAPAVLKRRSRSLSISRAGLEGTAARYWSEVRIAAREAVREHVPDCQTARQRDCQTQTATPS